MKILKSELVEIIKEEVKKIVSEYNQFNFDNPEASALFNKIKDKLSAEDFFTYLFEYLDEEEKNAFVISSVDEVENRKISKYEVEEYFPLVFNYILDKFSEGRQLGVIHSILELYLSDDRQLEVLKALEEDLPLYLEEKNESSEVLKETDYPEEWKKIIVDKWPKILNFFLEKNNQDQVVAEEEMDQLLDSLYADLNKIASFNDINRIKEMYSSGDLGQYFGPIKDSVLELITWMATNILKKEGV